MTKKVITMLLTAAMLLAAVGCTPSEPAENSSTSTPSVTQEEIDALKAENERLQQELDALKGEDTETEGEDAESEADTSSEAAGNSGASSQASAPATTPSSQPANTQAPTANNNSSSAAASKPNNQAAAKPTGNNSQATASTPAPQKTSSGKGPLAKYTVNVSDSGTPAVKVVGETLNGKSAYYFYSDSSKLLGNIPMDILTTIIRENGLSYAEADEQKAWFVENFNVYRGLDGGEYEPSSPSSGSATSTEIDIDEFRDEVLRLVNNEREKEGLSPLEENSTAMKFAQIRAEEISENFSHTRPDGTIGEYSHYQFTENIVKGGRTPEEAVNSWMNSSGHRATILSDYEDYGNKAGIGVYKANGTMYWVLEIIIWDANA